MKITEAVKLVLKSTALKSRYRKKPVVMDSQQTLDYIINTGCSIARYGDGELSVIEKRNLKFQKYDEKLATRLSEIKTNDKCLVCVPDVFSERLNSKDIKKDEYSFWKKSNIVFGGMWNKHFGNVELLGDAFVSRFYMRYNDKTKVSEFVQKLKKLWDKRNIIFVEGNNSRLGVGNDLFDNAKSIKRILCPEVNAFDKYDEILASVKEIAKKKDLVVLALGPTATVLAYDLSADGYQALDLGHIDIEYEWFKMGAIEKVPVPNKHVNECNSMGYCDQKDLNKDYLKQIIKKI